METLSQWIYHYSFCSLKLFSLLEKLFLIHKKSVFHLNNARVSLNERKNVICNLILPFPVTSKPKDNGNTRDILLCWMKKYAEVIKSFLLFLYAQSETKNSFPITKKKMIQIHVLRVLRMFELLPRLLWQMRSIKLLYESQKFYIITKKYRVERRTKESQKNKILASFIVFFFSLSFSTANDVRFVWFQAVGRYMKCVLSFFIPGRFFFYAKS